MASSRRNSIVSALLVAALAHLASAQVFHVPGDFPTLPAALAGVPADAVIVVHGGNHPPITVTKPVTIVGSPQATIVNTDVDDPIAPFKLANAITLAGAGSGRVTLSSVRTTGSADGSFYSISGAGIFGGGFSELHLTDCSIQPAQWTALTGQAQGANALTVFLPYVLLERCTVVGGLSDTDACDYPWNPSGGAGVAAPGATVAVLDSTVTGGRGPIMCFSDGNCPGGPLMESDGGPGIVAATVLRAASTISGGKGQPVTCGSTIVGTELDGPAIVAGTVTDLGTALTASGAAVMGLGWTLTWSTSPPTSLLVVGTPSVAPLQVGTKGLLFLDAVTMKVFPVAGGIGQSITSTLPTTAALSGVEFGAQVYDIALQHLTRPVVAVFQP